ncbi:hypothetical protein CRUP_009840, partial [Coryphaenoides rupestris]
MLNMAAVLVLLVGVTDGVNILFCDTTQPDITTKCLGSLGGTLEVQLMTALTSDRYTLRRNQELILNQQRTNNPRFSFNITTGILTVNDLNRKDNDTYLFELFDKDGKEKTKKKLVLSIQAPVTRPHLSSECLSNGEQRVSCSAGGDGPDYSWSLDGDPMTGVPLLSGNRTASEITLPLGWSGLLTCSVSNNVSSATANITLSVCDGLDYPYYIIAIVVVPVLVLAAIGVYYAVKKRESKDTAPADNLIYANVTMHQRPRKPQVERESDVEYGEVKAAPAARRTAQSDADTALLPTCLSERPSSRESWAFLWTLIRFSRACGGVWWGGRPPSEVRGLVRRSLARMVEAPSSRGRAEQQVAELRYLVMVLLLLLVVVVVV